MASSKTEPLQLATIPRDEFLEKRWDYKTGEHVTLLGPTGSGKTHLGNQLLAATATPERPAIIAVIKPRDETTKRFAKANKLRIVRGWPPLPSQWNRTPKGYVLWPKHSFDPQRDNRHLHVIMRRAMLDAYRRGERIFFADEMYGLVRELMLTTEAETLWTRGRSMGCGLWCSSQKPTHIPLLAYNQAEHLFLAYEPDKRGRERFSEIGGIEDARRIEDAVLRLGEYQWLYIKRRGRHMCIVDR